MENNQRTSPTKGGTNIRTYAKTRLLRHRCLSKHAHHRHRHSQLSSRQAETSVLLLLTSVSEMETEKKLRYCGV